MRRRVGANLGIKIDIGGLRGAVERPVERLHDLRQPVGGAVISLTRLELFIGPDRRDDGQLVAYRIEDDDDLRPDQHRIRQTERVGWLVRQVLNQPHRVVAQIAEHAGRRGRQIGRHGDAAFRKHGADGGQCRLLCRLERRKRRRPADFRVVAVGPEDQVRVQADHRIAAAYRAALHRFQQEGIGAARRQLQIGRHRRLQVGDETRPHDLGATGLIGCAEFFKRWLDLHYRVCVCPVSCR